MKKTTQRTLERCKRLGWPADKAEEWVFGFAVRQQGELGAWLEERFGSLQSGDLEILVRLARAGLRHIGAENWPRAISSGMLRQLDQPPGDPIVAEPPEHQLRRSPGRRRDLLGFVDVVALEPYEATVERRDRPEPRARLHLIQSTAGSGDLARHLRKMNEPELRETVVLATRCPGVVVSLWSWRQVVAKKKDGTPAKRKAWQPRIAHVGVDELGFLELYKRETEAQL